MASLCPQQKVVTAIVEEDGGEESGKELLIPHVDIEQDTKCEPVSLIVNYNDAWKSSSIF